MRLCLWSSARHLEIRGAFGCLVALSRGALEVMSSFACLVENPLLNSLEQRLRERILLLPQYRILCGSSSVYTDVSALARCFCDRVWRFGVSSDPFAAVLAYNTS